MSQTTRGVAPSHAATALSDWPSRDRHSSEHGAGPAPTSGPSAGAHPRAWLAACGVLFAVAWGGNEFTPLLVMYRMEGLSAQAVNVLLGAYVFGIIPALLVGGPLSDRFGRRPLMLPAPALCIAGSALIAWGAEVHLLLYAGRVLSGMALGLVMAVGTSWVKELSQAPFAPTSDDGAGARRAALALTAGFGLGAVVAALLAQYGPVPTAFPYLVNIVVTAGLAVPVLRSSHAPESRPTTSGPGRLRDDLRIPAARHRRFLWVVLPMAPWVFGVAASAYAILPSILAELVAGNEILFSGLLCFVALSCGFATQQVGKRLDSPESSRAVAAGLLMTVVGLGLAAWAASSSGLVLAVVAAAVLGSAYGMLMVSGLQEVQRIAGPDHLAGLVAVYYSLTYLGFFVPTILGALAGRLSYPVMFAGGAVLAAGCWGVVTAFSRRHLPVAMGAS